MASPDFNLISSVIVGISSGLAVATINLLNTFLSNRNQRLVEKEKWLRDNLQEIYRNCIVNLSEFIEIDKGALERKEKLKQVKSWLSLILIYYPDSNSEESKLLRKKFDNLDLRRQEKMYDELRDLIIEIASSDSRIK